MDDKKAIDIEANLISRQDSAGIKPQNGSMSSFPDESYESQDRPETESEAIANFYETYSENSLLFNYFSIAISLTWVVIDFLIMGTIRRNEYFFVAIWMFVRTAYDASRLTISILSAQNIKAKNILASRNNSGSMTSSLVPSNSTLSVSLDSGSQNDQDSSAIIKRMKLNKMITKYSDIVYMQLFYSGVIFCTYRLFAHSTFHTTSIATIYFCTMTSFFYLSSPFMLLVLSYFKLNEYAQISNYFNTPKLSSRRGIKNLPITIHNGSSHPDDKDCVLCLNEYKKGEKICQLSCSSLHHFHETCARAYFKSNDECPICKAKVEEYKSVPLAKESFGLGI